MKFTGAFFLLFTFILGTTSCRKFEQEKIVAGAEPYIPRNLYPVERLPTYFNRVVVLPNFYQDSSVSVLNYSDDTFSSELSKTGVFEVVPVPVSFCKIHFGKERISSVESLPDNFLKLLIEEFGANGVLFVDLHSFNPYRPISIGVRSKLVDLKSGEFMWAIDETIDAGDASVMVTADAYHRVKHVQAISKDTGSSTLQSPRLFCKFVAATLFSTLPKR